MSSSMPSKIIPHDILKIYIFFLRHAKRPKATFYVKNTANICQIRKSRNRSLLKPGWKTVWKI